MCRHPADESRPPQPTGRQDENQVKDAGADVGKEKKKKSESQRTTVGPSGIPTTLAKGCGIQMTGSEREKNKEKDERADATKTKEGVREDAVERQNEDEATLGTLLHKRARCHRIHHE
ncbi:hypothetical protein B0H19DRAFT_1112012 [Mycena capillaripes]|nr:hypothetical protein B0H19DRAFT_1112012 [Mycena capillaripes]